MLLQPLAGAFAGLSAHAEVQVPRTGQSWALMLNLWSVDVGRLAHGPPQSDLAMLRLAVYALILPRNAWVFWGFFSLPQDGVSVKTFPQGTGTTCRPWARGTYYLNSQMSSCNKPARERPHAACLMPFGALVGEGEVKFLKDKGRGEGLLVNPNLKNKKGTKTSIKGKPDFLIYPERSQKLWVNKQGY